VFGAAVSGARAAALEAARSHSLPAPVPDPLQTSLEAALADFKSTQYDNTCPTAKAAYDAAAKIDGQLKTAFGSMGDAKSALTTADWSEYGLVALRATQAASSLALMLGSLFTASEVYGGLAFSLGEKNALISATSGLISAAQTAITALSSPGDLTRADNAMNAVSAAAALYGKAVENVKNFFVNGPFNAAAGIAFSAASTAVNIAGNAKDAWNDVQQHDLRDAPAAVSAYMTAADQYAVLLARLKLAVTKMKSAATDCAKKPATTTTPPKPKATTPTPTTKKTSGVFIYEDKETPNPGAPGTVDCQWGIGIAFAVVPGAYEYILKYYDALYNGTPDHIDVVPGYASVWNAQTDAPLLTANFNPKVREKAASEHFYGITGGAGNGPCGPNDPTEHGRFRQPPEVTAVFPTPPSIAGQVKAHDCSSNGCSDVPLAGVSVSASGTAGAGSATTDSSGNYVIQQLKPGSYTVTPSFANATFTPKNRTVKVSNNNLEGTDFVARR
jgi:hypothetical protein